MSAFLNLLISLSLSVFISLMLIVPAFGSSLTDDLAERIEKQKVFAPGTSLSIRRAGAEILISTYRNKLATVDDCKIEALLVAKTIFEAEPAGITRVKTYFYEPSLNKYREISLSKGDLLSFQSGQISEAELLSSISVKEQQVFDAADSIGDYVSASRSARVNREIKTRIRGQELDILTKAESSVDDDELKLEALKIAERALRAGQGYSKVSVIFADPRNRVEDRVVEFDTEQVKTMSKEVNQVVSALPLSKGQGKWLPSQRFKYEYLSVDDLYAGPGLNQTERAAILDRLQKLSATGVGVKTFLHPFLKLEDAAAKGDESEVAQLLKSLNTALDEQEATSASAKHAMAAKKVPTTNKPPANRPAQPAAKVDEGAVDDAYIRKQILANPASAYTYYVRRWRGKDKKPEDFPNYYSLMKLFVKTLDEAKRPAEAQIYQQKVDEVKKLHPDW